MKTSLSLSAFLLLSAPHSQGFVPTFTLSLHPTRSPASSLISYTPALNDPSLNSVLRFIQPLRFSNKNIEECTEELSVDDLIAIFQQHEVGQWFTTLLNSTNITTQVLSDVDVRAVEVFLKGTDVSESINSMETLQIQPSWKESSHQEQIQSFLETHTSTCNRLRIEQLLEKKESLNLHLLDLEQQVQMNLEQQQVTTFNNNKTNLIEQLKNLNLEYESFTEQKENLLRLINRIDMDLKDRQKSVPITDRLVETVVGDIKYHVMECIFQNPSAATILKRGLNLSLSANHISSLHQKLLDQRASFIYATEPKNLEDSLHRVILSNSLLPTYGYLAKAPEQVLRKYNALSVGSLPARKQPGAYTLPARLDKDRLFGWFVLTAIAQRAGTNAPLLTNIFGLVSSTDPSVLLIFDTTNPKVAHIMSHVQHENISDFFVEKMRQYFSGSSAMFENIVDEDLWNRFPELFKTVPSTEADQWAESVSKSKLSRTHPHLIKTYDSYLEDVIPVLESHFPYPAAFNNFDEIYAVHHERLDYVSKRLDLHYPFLTFLMGMTAIEHLRFSLAPEALKTNQPHHPNRGPYHLAVEAYRKELAEFEKLKKLSFTRNKVLVKPTVNNTFKRFAYFPNSTVVDERLLESLFARWYLELATGANEWYEDTGITVAKAGYEGVNERIIEFTHPITLQELYEMGGILVINLKADAVKDPVQAARFLFRHILRCFRYVFNL
ncbi:MAG: hypothetical protein V4629_12960 [Pseudomonadota bacterium]